MKAIAAVTALGLLVLSIGLLENPSREQQTYCDMVEIWEQSGGELGWPPYRGKEHCK